MSFDHLTTDERTQISTYLDTVERDMARAGVAPARIEAVRDALSEQIIEARAEAGDETDMAQLLKSIDPPDAFCDTEMARAPQLSEAAAAHVAPGPAIDGAAARETGLLGKLSLALALFGVFAAIIAPLGGPDLADAVGGPAFLFSELLALCLGFLSRRTIFGKAGLVCAGASLVFIVGILTLGL